MNQLARVTAVALLFGAAVQAGRLARPDISFACSCAPQRPIGEYVEDPGSVVVVGDIGGIRPAGDAPFAVRHVIFGGPILALQVVIDASGAGICNDPLVAGQRVVFVGTFADGVMRPRACAPFEQLGSPAGQRLLAEASAAFGVGTGEGPPAESFLGTTLAILASVVAVATGLFLVAALIVRRRTGSGT